MSLPRKLLVVRLGAIGDVTNALVFATALRDHEPRLEIDWVTHELAQPLVTGHPAIRRSFLWRRGSGLRGLRRLASDLNAERYDVAVDLQRTQKSAFLARRSGAKRVVGYHRSQVKELSWMWTNERIPAHPPRAHMVERYLAMAQHFGAPGLAPRHELPVEAASEGWAEQRVAELGGSPILISIGASKSENRWPAERFGELAARCAALTSQPVCLTGGPADRQAGELAMLAAEGSSVVDLVGASTISQLVSLLRRTTLHISCDTGPMHLAVACGVPTVALFGPASPWRTGPFGPGHAIVRTPPYDAAESPSDHRASAEPARMDAIDVDQVVAAVQAQLKC